MYEKIIYVIFFINHQYKNQYKVYIRNDYYDI